MSSLPQEHAAPRINHGRSSRRKKVRPLLPQVWLSIPLISMTPEEDGCGYMKSKTELDDECVER
jgi:hypothetical protein